MIAVARILMPEVAVRLSAATERATSCPALCFWPAPPRFFYGEKLLTRASENEGNRALLDEVGIRDMKWSQRRAGDEFPSLGRGEGRGDVDRADPPLATYAGGGGIRVRWNSGLAAET